MASRELKQLVVAGLTLDIYHDAANTSSEVVVLFLLHGRNGSMKKVKWIAESLLDQIAEKRERASNGIPSLVIVAFDQRNHGSRVVDSLANSSWKKNNERHAIDMYSIFVGTSRDVSFLIDFLPSYLYPSKEKTVSQWLIAGISLGGHSTWISLRTEPRIRLGIPVIGGANYLGLMRPRAASSRVAFKPPYIPDALVDIVKATDPIYTRYQDDSASTNPFFGKKILALSGADDKLVPFAPMEAFFNELNVGPEGKKKVIIALGVGHECTPDMVREMADFIWEESLTL
ncbi:hypothetical protein EUX98_g6690 [Antrodiella citrinella]|uniref:AB hydrolase-1 domain-containing protein n=1 Tax=Antrodiella citrinella TaxID=2447956 RepID=A0A4S4MVV3_9APHY|nr:hypothetical protein EUX98_g6690 [Antrodiella citrinella]